MRIFFYVLHYNENLPLVARTTRFCVSVTVAVTSSSGKNDVTYSPPSDWLRGIVRVHCYWAIVLPRDYNVEFQEKVHILVRKKIATELKNFFSIQLDSIMEA